MQQTLPGLTPLPVVLMADILLFVALCVFVVILAIRNKGFATFLKVLGAIAAIGICCLLAFRFSAENHPMDIEVPGVINRTHNAIYEDVNYNPNAIAAYSRTNFSTDWSKIFLIAPLALLLLGGLLAVISMLFHPKTRPWGIALLLVSGPILLLLIVVGSYGNARYRASEAYNHRGLNSYVQIQQNKPVAVKAEDAKALIDVVEKELISQYQPKSQQSSSNFTISPRMVRNVLLPLPPILPQVPAVELLQKIAVLESALKDIKQVLAKTMEQESSEDVTKGPDTPPANSTKLSLAAAIASALEKPDRNLAATSLASGPTPKTKSAKSAAEKSDQASSSTTRPDWVGKPPRRVGDSYQMSITVGPYTSRIECDANAPDAISEALRQFYETYYRKFVSPWILSYITPEKLSKLVLKEWEERIQSSVGPMTQLHLLVNFDQTAKALIDEARNSYYFSEHAVVVGVVFGGVWLFLAWIWANLKLDLATKGVYRKRLRFVNGSIILLIAAIVLVALIASFA